MLHSLGSLCKSESNEFHVKGTILSLFLFIERGVAWLLAVLLVVCLLFEIALKRLFFQQFASFKYSFHLCICGQIGQTTAEKQAAWSYFGESSFFQLLFAQYMQRWKEYLKDTNCSNNSRFKVILKSKQTTNLFLKTGIMTK